MLHSLRNAFITGIVVILPIGVTLIAIRYLPTTPNPNSDFLRMLPEEDITRLDMAISDGMKLIISGAAVVPNRSSGEAVLINSPAEVGAAT